MGLRSWLPTPDCVSSASGSCVEARYRKTGDPLLYFVPYLAAHDLSWPSLRYAFVLWFVLAAVLLIVGAFHHAGVGERTWIGAVWNKYALKRPVWRFGRALQRAGPGGGLTSRSTTIRRPSAAEKRAHGTPVVDEHGRKRQRQRADRQGSDAPLLDAPSSHSYPPPPPASLGGPPRPPSGALAAASKRARTLTLPSLATTLMVSLFFAVPIALCFVGADYINPNVSIWDVASSFPTSNLTALQAQASAHPSSTPYSTLPPPTKYGPAAQDGTGARKRAAAAPTKVRVTTNVLQYTLPYKDWWTVGDRTGLIAFSTIPLVVLLALKQVPFALLALPLFAGGYHFDRLSFLHRWGGRLVFLLTAAHVGTWTVQLVIDRKDGKPWEGNLWSTALLLGRFRWGLVSAGFLFLLTVTSIGPIRRRYYEVFYISHVIFVLGFLVTAWLHHPPFAYWIYVSLFWWIVERVARAFKVAWVNGLGKVGEKPLPLLAEGVKSPGVYAPSPYGRAPSVPPSPTFPLPRGVPASGPSGAGVAGDPARPPFGQAEQDVRAHMPRRATRLRKSYVAPPRSPGGAEDEEDVAPAYRSVEKGQGEEEGKIDAIRISGYGVFSPDLDSDDKGVFGDDSTGHKKDAGVARPDASPYGPSLDPSSHGHSAETLPNDSRSFLASHGHGQDDGSSASKPHIDRHPLEGASSYHHGRSRKSLNFLANKEEGDISLNGGIRDEYADDDMLSPRSATFGDAHGSATGLSSHSASPMLPYPQNEPGSPRFFREPRSPRHLHHHRPAPTLSADAAALIRPGYAFVQLLPGRTIRMTLRTPRQIVWKPGQYVNLNVPAVRWWESHPFTIASAHDAGFPGEVAGDDEEESGYGDEEGSEKSGRKKWRKRRRRTEGEERTIVLLFRARQGFTLHLWDYVRRQRLIQLRSAAADANASGMMDSASMRSGRGGPLLDGPGRGGGGGGGGGGLRISKGVTGVHLRAFVDGPYGSSSRVAWGAHSTVLIICGGSGISWGMSILEHLCACIAGKEAWGRGGKGGRRFFTRRIRFIWIIREFAHLQWVASALRRCTEMVTPSQLQIELFVTHMHNNQLPVASHPRQPVPGYDDGLAPPSPGFAPWARRGTRSPSEGGMDAVADPMQGSYGNTLPPVPTPGARHSARFPGAPLLGRPPRRSGQYHDDDAGGDIGELGVVAAFGRPVDPVSFVEDDDMVADLTHFDGEDESAPTAGEMQLSNRVRKEGKLRRAHTRRLTAKAQGGGRSDGKQAPYRAQQDQRQQVGLGLAGNKDMSSQAPGQPLPSVEAFVSEVDLPHLREEPGDDAPRGPTSSFRDAADSPRMPQQDLVGPDADRAPAPARAPEASRRGAAGVSGSVTWRGAAPTDPLGPPPPPSSSSGPNWTSSQNVTPSVTPHRYPSPLPLGDAVRPLPLDDAVRPIPPASYAYAGAYGRGAPSPVPGFYPHIEVRPDTPEGARSAKWPADAVSLRGGRAFADIASPMPISPMVPGFGFDDEDVNAVPDDVPFDLDEQEEKDVRFVSEWARPGRPRLDRVLREEVERSQGRVMVTSCGPRSLNTYLRSIVANQIDPSRILRGDLRGHINLVTEEYTW